MTKKEYILSLLDSIGDIWEQADNVKLYLNQDDKYIDDNVLDEIITHLDTSIADTHKDIDKQKHIKDINILKKIKIQEKELSDKEHEGLEYMINNI